MGTYETVGGHAASHDVDDGPITQRVIWGASEDIEAEYSARAADPFTVAEAEGDEIYVVRGYPTYEAARRALEEYRSAGIDVEMVGRGVEP